LLQNRQFGHIEGNISMCVTTFRPLKHAKPEVASERRLPSVPAGLSDFSFCAIALTSALTTMFVLITGNSALQSRSTRGVQLSWEPATRRTQAAAHQPSPLLRSYLSHQSKEVKNQIRFVSTLIQAHKQPIEDAEQLAYLIVAESFRAGYDPLFVAAIIKSESRFKRAAVSHRGARGLMQIMPGTGKYVSQKKSLRWSGSQSLHDPTYNIKLGIAYLKYLDDKFTGNKERVLIAYNWGPGNVEASMRGRRRPPTESLKYARQILANHQKWKSIYANLAAVGIPSESN
jgi:soluble lytic murein transglycosylase-like protein